ncbi:MAG: winged helix-turn-helix transcriptional regulator [Methylacidiphilales bacterium]|nr:winged helix-turn-helix transcriptional regulator [Candidatus Methylacidiphilales bacterium]
MSPSLSTSPRIDKVMIDQPRVDIAELLQHARVASEFLKALAHESRLVILCLLAEGEKSVMELAELLGERQPAVSQQLARLKGEHLVQARRDGKHIYYSLARDEVRDVIVALHAAFCAPARTAPEAAGR